MSLPLENAKYTAKAIGCSFGNSENGNTQIAIDFEITEGEHAGAWLPWVGHFTELTADRTIESLRHMGWQGDDLAELDGLDAAGIAEKLPDVVSLVCEPEEYDGKQRLRVRWVNKGAGKFAFKAPVTGQDLRAFAAQMRAKVRAIRPEAGPRRTTAPAGNGSRPTQPHPNAPGNRDDIPF
jgi:hypothetical protein